MQYSEVIHELKNPLLAIKRLASMVLEGEGITEDTQRKLELIRDSAQEASGYLGELDVSSPPSAPEGRAAEPVDVGDLARQVVDSFQIHAEYKSQELRCRISDEDCMVVGDAVQLRKAMSNLVSNALKYTPSGGQIEVRVDRAEETVRVSVSDNGPGLSGEEKERMFEPFRRPGPEPTGGGKSSGLGLYVVKEVTERHGGRIEAETAEGVGSTFMIELPAAGSRTAGQETLPDQGTLPDRGEEPAGEDRESDLSVVQSGHHIKISVSLQLTPPPSDDADSP